MRLKAGELFQLTHSISHIHLGIALDHYSMLSPDRESDSRQFASVRANHLSVSVVCHALFALESLVTAIGDEMFFYPRSHRYLAKENRDKVLETLLSSWRRFPFIERLEVVLFISAKETMPAPLRSRLLELVTLRNWLVHGNTFTTTLLLEESPEEPDSLFASEHEHSLNWDAKFPNTKFNPISGLTRRDAKLGLEIVFEAMQIISEVCNQPISFTTTNRDAGFHTLFKKDFEFASLLS